MFFVVISCVVFPNSLKLMSAASLTVCLLCSAALLRLDRGLGLVLVLWLASAIITGVYLLVGTLNGAPIEAVQQVLLIYVAFPLAWTLVLAYLLQTFRLRTIVGALVIAGTVGAFSVPVFYYAVLNGWTDIANFFIEDPIVDIRSEGYAAATMYVFGSLIFVTGGYIASFDQKARNGGQIWLVLLFVLVALASGRGALILAVLIGATVNLLALFGSLRQLTPLPVLRFVLAFALACIAIALLVEILNLRLSIIIEPVIDKLLTAGGEGRRQQLDALLQGIAANSGLGSGHGVGVSYTVSDTFPWRYEMVWVATTFRVGIIGALVYAAPFILAGSVALRDLLLRRLDRSEVFLLGAFAAAFVASNTNPYIEAFVFQWMYVLPVLYFISRSVGLRRGVLPYQSNGVAR